MTSFLAMGQNKGYSAKEKAIFINHQISCHFRDSKRKIYHETNELPVKDNEHSYLWPLCTLMQRANEMEALVPEIDYLGPILRLSNNTTIQHILLLVIRPR
ncbi:hypothetical protein EZ428_19580 [Pedobacter frigiditerrae]|uniref:Uncharacterized protein n=1 Tax=Pedobacter frigiditerrae TaxID=2530452 RepID=A0A4R0MMJ2_9SPHI|nr:hypothetical protein EZ428_19580 [Pedobacter frigiditerrae]